MDTNFDDGYRIREDESDVQITELLAIQQANPNLFLVWYAGPGIHPDHPTDYCLDTATGVYCGHSSDCGTHSIPACPSEPCDCKRDH